MISPNLEVFVNGVRDTVETNGTKLDRSQVFALPEIEYAVVTDEEQINPSDYNHASNVTQAESRDEYQVESQEEDVLLNTTTDESIIEPFIPISPTRESETSGRFVSSSCCSICLDEFRQGEVLRLLPRCQHAFHTECILPWLTERQGCCPMCKVPVLPDEQQRSRSRTPRRRRRLRSSRGGRPQTSTTEDSSPERENSETHNIVSGIRLVSEVDSDLDAAYHPNQGVVTPDSSPISTSQDDLLILEEGQPPSQDPNSRNLEPPADIVRDLSIFYTAEERPATDEQV